jgi:AraC-like DNA-binding protein
MLEVRMASPNPVLKEFVRVYAQREVFPLASDAKVMVEAIPARLEQILEFQFGERFTVSHWEGFSEETPDIAIIGAQMQGCSRIELRPGTISFGVFFRPAGLSRLMSIPVCEMANRSYDAELICKSLRELRERLAECGTFEQRVRVMEGVLLALAARSARKEMMIEVAERIFSLQGAVRISHLASQTGLGLRQFERRFQQTMGVTPKLYARVARFQSALDAKIASPHLSWVEIAHHLNYHDQMHMIRDFQVLGGDTPVQLLTQIGDARPGALLAADFSHR